MKITSINDYLQFGAALGVILGLGLVVYEIRENNRISYQQALSATYSNWAELSIAEVESGISHEFSKAITNADKLTLAEKIKLDQWLTAIMSLQQQDYVAETLGNGDVSTFFDDLVGDVPYYFGNKYTRGWYLENKYWIDPEIVRVIDDKLLSTPLGSDISYFDRVNGHFR